jgi:hypothetical protein
MMLEDSFDSMIRGATKLWSVFRSLKSNLPKFYRNIRTVQYYTVKAETSTITTSVVYCGVHYYCTLQSLYVLYCTSPMSERTNKAYRRRNLLWRTPKTPLDFLPPKVNLPLTKSCDVDIDALTFCWCSRSAVQYYCTSAKIRK